MPIFMLPGDLCPQKSEEPFHSTVGSSSPPDMRGKDDTAGCGCQHLRSPELLPCLSLPIQATKTWQGHPRPHTLATGTARGAKPLWLAWRGGHIFGPPYLQHPARWGS